MITPSRVFLETFKATNGALSVCESIAIMNIAVMAPKGLYAEFGVFHGKSAMSALVSLKEYSVEGDKVQFILCDPIFSDLKLCESVYNTFMRVCGNKLMEYCFEQTSSVDEILKRSNYSYVFIDSGDHQSLPMIEVKLLEDRMIKDGVIAFHDLDSQFLQVREAYDYLVSTGKYDTISIDWQQIIDYVRDNDLEKGNLSWHHNELEFPCFVGALRRK